MFVNSTALRQGSNAVAAGGKDSAGPSDTGSSHPVILQRDLAASPSGASSPTASARLAAAASPRRISTPTLARDPRTGKGMVLTSFPFSKCIVIDDSAMSPVSKWTFGTKLGWGSRSIQVSFTNDGVDAFCCFVLQLRRIEDFGRSK